MGVSPVMRGQHVHLLACVLYVLYVFTHLYGVGGVHCVDME